MSTKSKLLIISVLLLSATTLLFGDEILTPRYRITEVEKLDQHIRVQDEHFENHNRLKGFQDDNYSLFGVDTVNAAGQDTVFLSTKYASASAYIAVATVKGTTNRSTAVNILSDSSFAVKTGGDTEPYYWIAIGEI